MATDINYLFETGQLLKLEQILKETPDQIPEEMKPKLLDDLELFREADKRIIRDKSLLQELHQDPKRGEYVYINKDNYSNFEGYNFALKNLDLMPKTDKLPYRGENGI